MFNLSKKEKEKKKKEQDDLELTLHEGNSDEYDWEDDEKEYTVSELVRKILDELD